MSTNLKTFKLFNESVDRTLKLVLAGPILRKVTSNSVTVWVALHSPRSVKLRVLSDTKSEQFLEITNTIKVGEHLHIACVTAETTEATKRLLAGRIYLYEVLFAEGNNQNWQTISDPSITSASFATILCYGTRGLPSFVLPPDGTDLSNLKIVHGSCRKPHGMGPDALRALDGLLKDNIENPAKRPQILCLTGDQIYADDVDGRMAEIVHEIAQKIIAPGVSWAFSKDRQKTVNQIGFTSEDAQYHLIRFAEFCAMYLLSWSDILWPTDTLKLPDNLGNFKKGLTDVRRVLANIPTYMIFDDHEITDDWYRTKNWYTRTYSPNFNTGVNADNYMAHAVIANGLLAYALFQGWGNLGAEANNKFPFKNIMSQCNNPGNNMSNLFPLRLELAPLQTFAGKYTYLNYGINGSPWSFRVDYPNFQLLFLDTRTLRAFDGNGTTPILIHENHLALQLGTTAKQITFVISATPVFGVEDIENILNKSDEKKGDNFDSEAWSHNTMGFLNIQKALAAFGKVVILSGDVHYGYTNLIEFWHEEPSSSSVLVQCCASPLKNPPKEWMQDGLDLVENLGGPSFVFYKDKNNKLNTWFPTFGMSYPTNIDYQYRVQYLKDSNSKAQIIYSNHFGLVRFDKSANSLTHELYGPQNGSLSKPQVLATQTALLQLPSVNDKPIKK